MQTTLDLLDHAQRLLLPLAGVPAQTDLRRSVSASYYAVFHLLVEAASGQLGQSASPVLRLRIARAFGHREMRSLCEHLIKVTPGFVPKPLAGLIAAPVHPDLRDIAAAFVDLQDARHYADYDFASAFTLPFAANMLANAQRCASAWPAIQALPETTTFLTALLLADRWTRRG